MLRKLVTPVALLSVASCGVPSMKIRSNPSGAVVHQDARPLATPTPIQVPLPYYGTVLLEFEKLPPNPSQDPVRKTVLARIEPAASGWIFPLDLVAEGVQWLAGNRDHEIEAHLEPVGEAKLDAASIEELIQRARSAAIERR